MTHRSRLSMLLIDTPTQRSPRLLELEMTDDPRIGGLSAIWSQALGTPARAVPGDEQSTALPGALPDLILAVRSVDDQARYRLNVETDDVDAETDRLPAPSRSAAGWNVTRSRLR